MHGSALFRGLAWVGRLGQGIFTHQYLALSYLVFLRSCRLAPLFFLLNSMATFPSHFPIFHLPFFSRRVGSVFQLGLFLFDNPGTHLSPLGLGPIFLDFRTEMALLPLRPTRPPPPPRSFPPLTTEDSGSFRFPPIVTPGVAPVLLREFMARFPFLLI